MPDGRQPLTLARRIIAAIGIIIMVLTGGCSLLFLMGNAGEFADAVWVVGGILSLLGALTYGELSAMNPAAGGLYVYIRDCFGRFPAFLFGWILFFVVSTGSIATLAVAFSNYLGEFFLFGHWTSKLISLLMIGVQDRPFAGPYRVKPTPLVQVEPRFPT